MACARFTVFGAWYEMEEGRGRVESEFAFFCSTVMEGGPVKMGE